MFSNRQQDDSSNLLRQMISTSSSIGSSSTPQSDSVATIATNNYYDLSATPVTTTNLAFNGLNCGKTSTCTSPTVTPSASEDFTTATASGLHHNVSSSRVTLNMQSSGSSNSVSQDFHTFKNLGMLLLNPENQNQTILKNVQHRNNLNQNNYYSNSSSSIATYFANFVSPIGSDSCNIPQSGVINNNFGSNSMLSAKSPDGEDNDSAVYNVTNNDTMLRKVTQKRKMKNNLKNEIQHESKNTPNSSCQTDNKAKKIMFDENKYLKQREQNRLAAARCRKRRMDYTNELEGEIKQLEKKRLILQSKVPALRYLVTDLQNKLAQHKCVMNNGSGFN